MEPEAVPGGPTHQFAAALSAEFGIPIHASLYEAAPDGGLGFNTAIVVARPFQPPSPMAPPWRMGPLPSSTVSRRMHIASTRQRMASAE